MPAGLSSIADASPDSEQNVVAAGAIAVSVIEGNHEAPARAERDVARLLRDLLGPAPERRDE